MMFQALSLRVFAFVVLFALVSSQCADVCHNRPKPAYKSCWSGGKPLPNCHVIRCAQSNPKARYRGWSCSAKGQQDASPTPTPSPKYTTIPRGCRNICHTKAANAWGDCLYQKKFVKGCKVKRCDTDKLPYKGWACAPMHE